ncbi:MAG: class I SAM-dependent methyltransferase [Candidatus Cloacimonadaceae bacterium]|jgi:SAM-dependent methyltransferase|nr:class I SAM-dependent methyltransferase [Candidatus Cloacimonadota bacterium]MDY0126646.1 class I SAM-dependent methyltransferase [Candidatus Cloacimonadaceae bacterium]MCB5255259.1 class I SAM-dependent methyltransferase [Candidatus Cloacimonadota bacterium]MCK9177481.1 class I SAM-dependent methyltransferase [Candidatus Cloacimonadota bacterium]MCK9242745.1 class I SAM-dependent methyltransferase [Candidatus Cloacimonadota bacterium]
MKLKLLFEDAVNAKVLRFYPLQNFSSWQLVSEYQAEELAAGQLNVCPDFALAKALWGERARLHICRYFGIVYLPNSVPAVLGELLRNHTLYLLSSDQKAAEFLVDDCFHSLDYMSEFYDAPSSQKLLICSGKELVNAVLSSAPQAFMHFILESKSYHLCLGAELWRYRADAFRTAFYFAEKLCGQITDLKRLPYMTAQICLQDGHGSYAFFADRYDSYMAHVDYDLWYSLLTNWHKSYSRHKCKKVLELACGTANVACRFVQAGAQVDACDISCQMLENAWKKELKPNLYQASLTDPIPGRDYDLILCLFDSMNYLSNLSQISTCLTEVALALAEDGLFIFDISTLLNSMENFFDSCQWVKEQDSGLVHQSFYEMGQRRQNSRLSLFKRWGASYSLQEEEHRQRVYLVQELVEIIQDSPLQLKAIHSTNNKTNFYPKKLSGIDHRHYRLFFILKKDELSK